MSSIEPLFGRVVIKRPNLQNTTSLIIPEEANKRNAPSEGEVIAVGPTCDESIQPGMKVLFGRYAGDWFKHGDQEWYVCQDEDIIAVVT